MRKGNPHKNKNNENGSRPTRESWYIMTKSELLKNMKNEAMARVNLDGATQIGEFEYAVPGEGGYVTITITAKNPSGTEKVPAFSLDKAVEDYKLMLEDRERRALEKAAKKAAKLANK